MASVYFDKSTNWWKVKYYAGATEGTVTKAICRHPGSWSKSRPPRRPTADVQRFAEPFIEAERRARLGQEAPRLKKTALAVYVRAYLERAAVGHAENTRKGVGIACRQFVRWCEGRKIRFVQDVTYAVCRDWIADRLTGGAARSTVVTERSHLMPVWTQALMERAVTENPWLAAKVPGKARKEIPTAWTRDEVMRLVAVADNRTPDYLADLILLGVNTGIRIGALLRLRWEQVDWDAGLIRVRAATSKSGRPYEVPISPTAHDLLARRLAAGAARGLVFPSRRAAEPLRSRTTFERIRRAVRRAGVPDYGDFNHVLRRTFATLALNSGIALEVVSRCLDHATLAQTQRAYAHLLNERLIQGMAGFDVSRGPTPPAP